MGSDEMETSGDSSTMVINEPHSTDSMFGTAVRRRSPWVVSQSCDRRVVSASNAGEEVEAAKAEGLGGFIRRNRTNRPSKSTRDSKKPLVVIASMMELY